MYETFDYIYVMTVNYARNGNFHFIALNYQLKDLWAVVLLNDEEEAEVAGAFSFNSKACLKNFFVWIELNYGACTGSLRIFIWNETVFKIVFFYSHVTINRWPFFVCAQSTDIHKKKMD